MQAVTFEARHMAVGLDLSSPRNLKPGAISDGYSARYIKNTGIYTGPGYFQWADLGTSAAVDDMFGGRNAILKSLWGKSGTKIFHGMQTLNTAYEIGLTLTAAERQAFLEARNGDILSFNQTDSPARIATAKITTVALTTLASGVITVGTGYIDKFTATGTVYMNGVSYTYGGKSATELTTLGGGPLPTGGLPIGTIVTQTSTPSSFSAAKGTCGMFMEGSTLIAGVKGREDVVYTSAPATFDNPEYAYDFSDNGASAKVMENPVVAMIKGNAQGYLFGHNWCQSSPGFNVATNILETYPVSETIGAYNARCVVNMGGRVAMLGEKRLMPVDLFLSREGVSQGRVDEEFDTAIRPFLDQFDPVADQQDVALLEYDISRGWLSATGSINGVARTLCFDTRDGVKAFTPEEIRPMRCHVFFDGESYFGSNSDDKVFLNHATFTNNGFPILHRWSTGEMEAKRGSVEIESDTLMFDGFMSSGCEVTVKFYIDGNSTAAYSIDLTDSIITSAVGVAIGTRAIGISSIAGGEETPALAYPYSAEIDLNGLLGRAYRIEWECSTLGAYFEVDSFVFKGKGIEFTSTDRS